MKKIALITSLLAAGTALFAAEHPISPKKNSEMPGSFYMTGKKTDGIKCVKNDAGKYVFRVHTQDGMRKIISGQRIAVAEKDTVTFRITVNARAKSVISTGFYLYYEVNRKTYPVGAAYQPVIQVTPEKKVYEFTKVIPGNPKAKSAFEKPSIGIFFFDFKKGSDLDVEKIEYTIKKAPQAAAPAVPDF